MDISNSIRRLVGLALLLWCWPANAQIFTSYAYTFSAGTVIASAQVNANFNKIGSDVNANGAKNGVNTDLTRLLGILTGSAASPSYSFVGFTTTGFFYDTTNSAVAVTVAGVEYAWFSATKEKFSNPLDMSSQLINNVANPVAATDAANKTYVDTQITANISNARNTSFRQGILAAPMDVNGNSTLLPATSGSLSLTSQNVTSTTPLVVTSANGGDAVNFGEQNFTGSATANLTWSSLPANQSTIYLYVTIGSNGALTTGNTTCGWTYQYSGTPNTASGCFTFNYGEMKGYLGNGSTAPQTYLVIVGDAVTSATTVSSTRSYVPRGRWVSGWSTPLVGAATAVSVNHNTGFHNNTCNLRIQNTTADNGYATGDEVISDGAIWTWDGGTLRPMAVWANNWTGGFTTASGCSGSTCWQLINKSTGAFANLTLASWKYRVECQRSW